MAEKTRPRRQPRPSLAPREVVLGIDATERKVAIGIAALGAIFGVILAVLPIPGTAQVKLIAGKCPAPAYLLHKVCTKNVTYHFRDLWLYALVTTAFAALAVYFAVKKRRSGTAFSLLIIGFAVSALGFGVVALLFWFAAGWLMIRGRRLMKYGVAGFADANIKARELNLERRAAKANGNVSAARAVTTDVRRAPQASKRYTPPPARPTKKKLS